MAEVIAMISEDGKIELVDERIVKIVGTGSMTPADAAFLARSLLSCAAHISLEPSPKVGALIGDLHLPILKWTVTTQTETKRPVVIFSIPPGIDVTFQISPQVAKALGEALVAQAAGNQRPEQSPDTVH